MYKDEDMIVVRNRNNGGTSYTVDNGAHWVDFEYNQVKKVPFGELKALT